MTGVDRAELKETRDDLGLVVELKRRRQAVEIGGDLVDLREHEVRELTDAGGLNDHHIVALLGVSGCRLLCTRNTRHARFFKDRSLYPDGKRPKIYGSARNSDLLCPANTATLRHTV